MKIEKEDGSEINVTKWVFLGILGVFLVITFFSTFVIVGTGERGVITNFGKVNATKVFDEGLHAIVPFVTSVKKITVQIQNNVIPAGAATKDLQVVNCKVAINWKLDPNKVNVIYQTIGDEQDVLQDIMAPAANEIIKSATAKRNVQSILVERTLLKTEIDEAFKVRMEKYGIIVVDVNLVDFTFDNEFQKAIEDKQIAEQKAQQAVYVAKQAFEEAKAEVNRATGLAESQRLQRQTLSVVMLKKMWIDKWNGKLPTVISGNNGGLILNLKEMSQETAETEAK